MTWGAACQGEETGGDFGWQGQENLDLGGCLVGKENLDLGGCLSGKGNLDWGGGGVPVREGELGLGRAVWWEGTPACRRLRSYN